MLYIPITEEKLDKLIQPDVDVQSIIVNLRLEELAALLLIQGLPTLLAVAKSDENLLFRAEQFISNFITSSGSFTLQEVQHEFVDALNVEKCLIGKSLLVQSQIQLMSAEQIQDKKYLKWEEQWVWNWEFKNSEKSDFFPSRLLNKKSSNTNFASKEEERIVNIILSDKDESIDIQGYAGSGKTWIISHLVDAIDKEKTLFLAETLEQVSALKARISGVRSHTFAYIAISLINTGVLKSVRNINGRYGKQQIASDQYIFSHDKLAEKLECYDIGEYRRGVIAKDAQVVVKNFCLSTDPTITREHISKQYVRQLTLVQQAALLTVAKHLWELICIPRDRILLPIRNYHLVKALALTGMGIPSHCTHIVVDEAHDLSPAIIQLLQQSTQPVFTFGDYYQNLQGLTQPHSLPSTLRKNTLTHSVRAGSNMTGLYNQLIERHPISPTVEFSGNKTKTTKFISYKKFQIPDEPCAILAKSFWSVFWIIYTLHHQSAKYHIFNIQIKEIDWLINSAISFLNNSDYKSRHHEFVGSHSWDDFFDKNRQREPALVQIDRLIRSGFNRQQLNVILQGSMPQPQEDIYLVRRVWDCRNIEFDRVLLLNDVIGKSGVINENYAKTISHIYTGISRAKHELYMPESISEWIDNC